MLKGFIFWSPTWHPLFCHVFPVCLRVIRVAFDVVLCGYRPFISVCGVGSDELKCRGMVRPATKKTAAPAMVVHSAAGDTDGVGGRYRGARRRKWGKWVAYLAQLLRHRREGGAGLRRRLILPPPPHRQAQLPRRSIGDPHCGKPHAGADSECGL